MKRILLATNGSGYQINKCLDLPFFKESIRVIVTDHETPARLAAEKHGIEYINYQEKHSETLNNKIIETALAYDIDFIISPGFTRIFRNNLLNAFPNRVFNCHPSILPAFKGFYDTRDTKRNFHARKIFERTLEFGSRVTGNTIHVITEGVDEGAPVLVSTLNIPYGEDPAFTRHRLFVQECKMLAQFVSWLNEDRVRFDKNGYPFIEDAQSEQTGFSPNLDNQEVLNFNLTYPWK